MADGPKDAVAAVMALLDEHFGPSHPQSAERFAVASSIVDAVRRLPERVRCTGMTASWCPIHGDCTCPDPVLSLDGSGCPLHSSSSEHACSASNVHVTAPVTRAEVAETVEAMCTRHGWTLERFLDPRPPAMPAAGFTLVPGVGLVAGRLLGARVPLVGGRTRPKGDPVSDAIEYDWRVVYVDQRERELHDTGPMNEDAARAFMRATPDYIVQVQRRPVGAWEDVDTGCLSDSNLPTVDDIIGIDPGYTGGLSAVDYVRQMRDGRP